MRGRRSGDVRIQERKLLWKVCVWNNIGLQRFGNRYFVFGKGRNSQSVDGTQFANFNVQLGVLE